MYILCSEDLKQGMHVRQVWPVDDRWNYVVERRCGAPFLRGKQRSMIPGKTSLWQTLPMEPFPVNEAGFWYASVVLSVTASKQKLLMITFTERFLSVGFAVEAENVRIRILVRAEVTPTSFLRELVDCCKTQEDVLIKSVSSLSCARSCT